MPRKFRLSVHRKNEFRKKRALKLRDSLTEDLYLVVSIPKKHFIDSFKRRVQDLAVFPNGWQYVRDSDSQVVVSRIEVKDEVVTVSRSITISQDMSWSVSAFGRVLPSKLSNFPKSISTVSLLEKVVSFYDACCVCVGNPDVKYRNLSEARKGTFMDVSGRSQVALQDSTFASMNTIRSQSCQLLVQFRGEHLEARCSSCLDFRKILNSMLSRHNNSSVCKTGPSSHVNFRYLNTPEKVDRLQQLHKSVRTSHQRVERLKARLESVIDKKGIVVDADLHEDLSAIMKENTPSIAQQHPPDSFARLFWEQQLKASSLHNARSMKWAPMMIRWCLYLRHLSSSAYETLRSSGAIMLPSQRTLRDYTHYTQAACGFSTEVDKQLMDIAGILTCPEREKYVVILMDEMHIKENLVYDKHSGSLIGYANLGDGITAHLEQFQHYVDSDSCEEVLAKSMLVLMVRGLFSQLKFPYAQFPCTSICGHQMFEPFWTSVCRLERCSFKVIALTCDGLAANRKLFNMHSSGNSLTYKVVNPYASDCRYIYFFSDPPHLIKTTRNAWFNSSRQLWCNGKPISWSHLVRLYQQCQPLRACPGLSLLPKLKFEHVSLTSFSKMRVDLAVQVLSSSVSKALLHTLGSEAEETAKFAEMFDKYFDCLNVSNIAAGYQKRSAFKAPYRSGSDFRLKWLLDEFLPYLDKWESDVEQRPGPYSRKGREMMLLSHETRTGLKLTALSFVDLVTYIFTIPGVSLFLSNRLCQDPLEGFFGQQRQRGKVNENPSVQQFVENTRALRVINGVCRDVKGNCRGSHKKGKDKIKGPKVNNTPLPKRKYKHK